MERSEVYRILDGERDYQDEKWTLSNIENGIPDEEKSLGEWLSFIQFHVNKSREILNFEGRSEKALDELRKLTTLGVVALEMLGCPERETTTNKD